MQHNPNNNLDAYLHDALSNAGYSPPSDMWARIERELPDEAEMAVAAALRDATVAPPEGVWEKIATQITIQTTTQVAIQTTPIITTIENITETDDDQALFDIFVGLKTHTVTPPADVWTRLEPVLPLEKIEDISFAALANYEIQPSADIWNRIENVLDAPLDADLTDFAALATAEITPSANLWDAIDARLTTDDELIPFKALAEYEVAPPADFWSRLDLPAENTSVLTQFDALAAHEVTPPAHNWEKIAAALDEQDDDLSAIMHRLRHAEQDPSAQVWSRVSQDLPLNPALRRHLTNFSRIAAVLLISFTASVFYNQWKNDDNGLAYEDQITKNATERIKSSSTKTVADNNGIKNQKTRRGNSKNTFTNNNSDNGSPNIVNQANPPNDNPTKIASNTNNKSTDFLPNAMPVHTQAAKTMANVYIPKSVKEAAIKDKNLNNAVNKTKQSDFIKYAPELPFPNTDNLDTQNGVAQANNNKNNIEPSVQNKENGGFVENVAPKSLKNENLAFAKRDTTELNALSPMRFLDKEMEALIAAEMKKIIDVSFNNGHLEFQFPERNPDSKQSQPPRSNPNENLDNATNESKKPPVYKLISYDGWAVNLNGQVLAPTIFNNSILQQLTPAGGEVTQAISFRSSFGVAALYQFQREHSIGLEYSYNEQGQTYLRASTNKNEVVDVNANYHRLSAFYNRQISLPTDRFGLGFVGGLQFGMLNEPSFKIQGDNGISINSIAKQDIGLMGGVDANYFFSKGLFASLGVRAAYTRDLTRFVVPDPLSNFNIGLRAGITYRLIQK